MKANTTKSSWCFYLGLLTSCAVKPVAEALQRAAQFAYEEANKPAIDMFGNVPKATKQDVLNQLKGGSNGVNTQGQGNLGQQAGGRFDAGDAGHSAHDATRTADAGAIEADRAGRADAGRADAGETTKRAAGVSELDNASFTQKGESNAEKSGIPQGLPSRRTAESKRLEDGINAELRRDGQTGSFRAETIGQDELPDALRSALESFRRATNTRVFLFRNLTPEVLDFNGVNFRDGIVYVNETSQYPLTLTATHEWLHNIKKTHPAMYKTLAEEVVRQGRLPEYQQHLRKNKETRWRNPDVVVEELTAAAVSDALTDPDFLHRLAERNQGVFKKVARAFLDFLKTITGKWRNQGSNRYLRDVETFRDKLEVVLNLYEQGNADGAISEAMFQRAWQGVDDKTQSDTAFRAPEVRNEQGQLLAPNGQVSKLSEGQQHQESNSSRFSRSTPTHGWLDDEPYNLPTEKLTTQQEQLIVDTFNENADGEKAANSQDVQESKNIYAKSKAFQALAQSEGWHIAPGKEGDKYFLLGNAPFRGTWGGAITISVRVSDHSNVNRGYHSKESAINLAPDDGYAFDDFESTLWKLRNAGENEDFSLTFGGEEAVYFSRKEQADEQFGGGAPWTVSQPSKKDAFTRNYINNKVDLKAVVDAVKATGKTIADEANPYLADELYIGRVSDGIEQLEERQLRPLMDAVAKSGVDVETLERYLHAKHAEERNVQMAKVNNETFTLDYNMAGMSTKEARRVVSEMEARPQAAEIKRLAKMVYAITRETRRRLVREGLATVDEINAWEGAYKNYVPLMRDVEESGKRGQGYNVRGNESCRAVGSGKEVKNILANAMAKASNKTQRWQIEFAVKQQWSCLYRDDGMDIWQTVTRTTIEQNCRSNMVEWQQDVMK